MHLLSRLTHPWRIQKRASGNLIFSYKFPNIFLRGSVSERTTPQLIGLGLFVVAGHCRYATALHGRQPSLWQMERAYRGIEQGQRTRSSLNARSVFRPPRVLRNLATN